jgi:hypothetical protein
VLFHFLGNSLVPDEKNDICSAIFEFVPDVDGRRIVNPAGVNNRYLSSLREADLEPAAKRCGGIWRDELGRTKEGGDDFPRRCFR